MATTRVVSRDRDGLVTRLLALGVKDGSVDAAGNGPLHYAARFGSPATVAALVAAKVAAVDEPSDANQTPLAIARAAARADVGRALIAAGAK